MSSGPDGVDEDCMNGLGAGEGNNMHMEHKGDGGGSRSKLRELEWKKQEIQRENHQRATTRGVRRNKHSCPREVEDLTFLSLWPSCIASVLDLLLLEDSKHAKL